MLREIHPVAGATVDAHFRDSLTNGFHVSHESKAQAEDTGLNLVLALFVLQAVKPLVKLGGPANLVHALSVGLNRQNTRASF